MIRKTGIFFIGLIILATACSVVQQTTELTNFTRCEFRIEDARNMDLAGIDIQSKDALSDFSFVEMAKIGSAIAGGTLPLKFDLFVGVKNPNPGMAAMNKLDWILLIDDIEMTRGILDKRIEIGANSVSRFPVEMSLDLMKSLDGKSGDALINFALNLSGNGTRPSRIKLKARPTIFLGSTPVEYPGYITIKQEFGSQ